jgi:hypothetical protein
LNSAISAVIESYRKNGQAQDQNNQVLVQPYLEDVTMSGVVFSKNLQTSSPYYTVNYDTSSDTEAVTSGSGESLHTFICYNDFSGLIEDEKLSKLIEAIKEIENVTKYDAIDVEFAFVGEELYILQVRPIAAKKQNVMVGSSSIHSEISSIKKRIGSSSISMSGSRNAYGVMPDWNPAEIIGTNPKKLSFDLYRYLITDNVWAESRAFLGYRETRSPGLVSFGGKPYVDIRMSFNTFIPKVLNDELSSKLVDFFIAKLESCPENHDKVEFLVAITSYDFCFDEKLKELGDNGFTSAECDSVAVAYRKLTQEIVLEETLSIDAEIKKTLSLEKRRRSVLNSNLDDVDKIYYLLEDCKKYGTLPFSNLARCGFVGSILLKSLLEKGCVSQEEYDELFKSIHTVAKEFMHDFLLLTENRLRKEIFIERYGHLRPGTYDITSKSYEEGFDEYIDFNSKPVEAGVREKFVFSESAKSKIADEIIKNDLAFDADTLIKFIVKATEAREKAKFEFTKSLSRCLDLVARVGLSNNIETDDMSHLGLETLLRYRNVSSRLNFRSDLINNIEKNKGEHLVTCSLNLPELIFNEKDVDMFHYPVMKPNFVTHHNIIGETVLLVGQSSVDIEGKVVCIENADPGFDWIFSHNIKGLITKFGGVASHMSIRCAEFDLPAAIGCGDKIFNNVSSGITVNLDCANKQIRRI